MKDEKMRRGKEGELEESGLEERWKGKQRRERLIKERKKLGSGWKNEPVIEKLYYENVITEKNARLKAEVKGRKEKKSVQKRKNGETLD